MPKRPYPAWQRRHEAILRWLIEHPCAKQYECAAATGYSPWQISRIVNSPDFRQRYREIRDTAIREAYIRGLFSMRRRKLN